MKSMLKLMLAIALVFASTFLIFNMTGIINIERIEHWLEQAQSMSSTVIALVVVTLLFADLFVAMPTLTIMLLAGYFLGPVVGAFSVVLGLTLAGFVGYYLSHRFGDSVLNFLVKDKLARQQAVSSFKKHGVVTILLSRAVPILPEVSACMAGLTRMPFSRFILAWWCSTIPYAVIASYAGSVSSVSNPQPAIFTAIGLTAFFWVAWFVFKQTEQARVMRKKPVSKQHCHWC